MCTLDTHRYALQCFLDSRRGYYALFSLKKGSVSLSKSVKLSFNAFNLMARTSRTAINGFIDLPNQGPKPVRMRVSTDISV